MTIVKRVGEILAPYKIPRFELTEEGVLRTDQPLSEEILENLRTGTGMTFKNEPIVEPQDEKIHWEFEKEESAVKHDQEKPSMALISSYFLRGLAQVLTFGAKKYSAHNWRKGFPLSRPYSALQRHLTDWNDGRDLDEESGLPVLWHAACELMFLVELSERVELDDRYQREYTVPKMAPTVGEPKTFKSFIKGKTEVQPAMTDIEGEWITVSVEGKESVAFVPKMIMAKKLPNKIFVTGAA